MRFFSKTFKKSNPPSSVIVVGAETWRQAEGPVLPPAQYTTHPIAINLAYANIEIT